MSLGVFVTGHVRSGTSMVAGLIRAHGVFFGECGGPTSDNPKGRVENAWVKATLHAGDKRDWPETFWGRMAAEGWDGTQPVGVKVMPKWWPWIRRLNPQAVVLCYRPVEDILASCARVGWARNRSEATIRQRWTAMEAIEADHPNAYRVDTPDIVKGDYSVIREVLDALSLELDEAAAQQWVDPGAFHVS